MATPTARGDQRRNLEKSIMLLDTSLYSPRNISKTPRSNLLLETSLFGSPGYDETRVLVSRGPATAKRRQTMDFFGRGGNATFLNTTSDLTAVETNNFFVDENLLQMFEDFLETYRSFPLDHQVFEQVAKYDAICNEQVLHFQKLIQTTPQGHSGLGLLKDLESEIRLERDTWRLVISLYQDRLNCENSEFGAEDEEPMDLESFFSETFYNESEFVNKLYEKNAQLRQAQLVVDWLEQKASDTLDESQFQFFGDPTAGWENTLHQLLTKQNDTNLVNEMDPDAPLRNRTQKLHPLDQEDETRLLRSVFAHIRHGQLDEAQQLFFRAGHPLRAAMLEGWRLFDDPNFGSESVSAQTKTPASGNPFRDIWKSTAWKACSSRELSTEEKAIYGSLCGHLDSLLLMSESWEDMLWSYFRTLVDRVVEKEMRQHVKYSRKLEPMPDSYWEQQVSVEGIFSAIGASRNQKVAAQAKDRYRILQRYIILDDVDGLLEEMHSWIQKPETAETSQLLSSSVDPQLLRLMAHLALFFRRIGRGSRDDLISGIIQSYVETLVAADSTELIAPYVIQLQMPSEQIQLFADCLVRTEEKDQCPEDRRRMLLSLADQVGLDVNAIAVRVVQMMCKQGEVEPANDFSLQIPTSREDEKRIQALGWLLIDQSMRADLLSEANALMRTFLLRRQIEALKVTYQAIPVDTIRTLTDQWQTRAGNLDLPAKLQNSVREYICFKTYMDAVNSFQDWFAHYHNSKPRPPTAESSQSQQRARPQINFAENLVREQQAKQYDADLQRWRAGLELLTKTATEKLYNVLLFPDGGWMVDSEEDAAAEQEDAGLRTYQMKLLRQSGIPHVAMLLVTVLQDSEQHHECLQLADVIAAEPHALYKVFTAEQMSRLLAQLRKSYVHVLDQGQDA